MELFLTILVAVFVASLAKDAVLAAYVNYQSNKFRRRELDKLSTAREEIMARLAEAAKNGPEATE